MNSFEAHTGDRSRDEAQLEPLSGGAALPGRPESESALSAQGEKVSPLTTLSLPALPAEEVSQALVIPAPTTFPLADAWGEVLTKLFLAKNGDRERIVYDRELADLEKELQVPSGMLLDAALGELKENAHLVQTDVRGRIINAAEVGTTFAPLYNLAASKVDVSIAASSASLYSAEFPLGKEMARQLEPVVAADRAVIVLVAKEPPLRAAEELRRISEERFGGMMSLWKNRELWNDLGVTPALKDYLEHATVRVLTTSNQAELNKLARSVNLELERQGGFEDAQWTSMVKGVTQGDRHHALKEALVVCFPVVIGVKALESFAPGLMHSVGGMLDDLFGAIIPDVSQSMGKKGLPFRERFKEAWPVLREGLTSLPIALGLGWGAATLHAATQSVAMHALSGALFALACSAGTVGTSIGAFRKASGTIEKLRADPVVGEHLEALGTSGRIKLALQESIFDVPFRVGHTVIGVPVQLALGVAAGVGGFFHNGLFVMAEGMLETVLGAATAFGYPGLKSIFNRATLKQLKPRDGASA